MKLNCESCGQTVELTKEDVGILSLACVCKRLGIYKDWVEE